MSLSQNISVGKIDEDGYHADSNEEKKESLIDIGKSKIHNSSTFLANSNPTLAQPIERVNPITNVAAGPEDTTNPPDSKNFNTNDANTNLDKSSQKSASFFSSYSDRNSLSFFAIQRYIINSINLLST